MSLQALHQLTRTLGDPARDYVIIAEGNTSWRMNEDTFYVKASGQQMQSIEEGGFVAVQLAAILDLLDNPPHTRTEQTARMMAARVDASATTPAPSIEVTFHAMLLHETGAQYIGHTHPSAVNQLLCGEHAQTFAEKRLFPDQAVICGARAVFVPYADPGLPLALLMREKVREYMAAHGEAPKEIMLANHGMIALGATPQAVLNITAMSVKAAKILSGALAVGKPVYMDAAEIEYLINRPDEIDRRKQVMGA
ncbi:MAG: class II aldolase/adducin family protein [Phototrophicaceae bacterium]